MRVAHRPFWRRSYPGSPFPNNTIPACLIDQNANSLLNAGGAYGGIFPKATSGASFIGGNNVPTKVKEEIVRVDHQINSKFSVFGHLISEQISQNYGNTMWSGDNVPTIGNRSGSAYSAVVHLTHMINPTLLNEVAFNYDGNRIHILPQGLVSARRASSSTACSPDRTRSSAFLPSI